MQISENEKTCTVERSLYSSQTHHPGNCRRTRLPRVCQPAQPTCHCLSQRFSWMPDASHCVASSAEQSPLLTLSDPSCFWILGQGLPKQSALAGCSAFQRSPSLDVPFTRGNSDCEAFRPEACIASLSSPATQQPAVFLCCVQACHTSLTSFKPSKPPNIAHLSAVSAVP